jgi:putative protease
LSEARERGARMFVLNAPWQAGLFAPREGLRLVGGPFCNLASAETAAQYAELGMEAAFVSPELSGAELLSLPRTSPIPLGIVVGGFWPLGITRILAEEVRLEEPILSPRGEIAWVRKFGFNHWIFPGWELDLSGHRRELEQAGYGLFATMREYWPKFLDQNTRTSVFNWDQGLL